MISNNCCNRCEEAVPSEVNSGFGFICTNPQCSCHQPSGTANDKNMDELIEKCVEVVSKCHKGGVYSGSYSAPREAFREILLAQKSTLKEEIRDKLLRKEFDIEDEQGGWTVVRTSDIEELLK